MPVRYLLATLVVLAIVLPLTAVADPADDSRLAQLDGRRALVFGVDGERLFSFDGAMIALRQQIGTRTALRLGLDFTLGDLDETSRYDRETVAEFPDTTVTDFWREESDGIDEDLELELDLLILRHLVSDRPVRFYFGAGPSVSYRHVRDTDTSEESQDDRRSRESRELESDTWYYGLRGIVGVEWFVTGAISVHGEYAASLRYLDRETTETSTSSIEYDEASAPIQTQTLDRTTTASGWSFGDAQARFGVSLFY